MASGSNAPGSQRASDASTRPPRPSLDGRTSLGKYEIVRQLGAGGMGTVYLAVDSQLKRTIALKVLPQDRTENETLVRRFEAEAQSAAQLKHENIITIYDAGRIDGHLYIALEYVEGTDIYDLVAKRGPLPLKRSINFVKQVTHALEHLHDRGFVHRDIKPSNILVTKQGTVKLTDMGLARAVDESIQSNITREGTTVGTVDYMAPEQARNSQSADIRSDIYSLGCTWYQMLTGEPPYPTGSVTNKLYSHISKPRPDPRVLNRSIPEEVVVIMHRMMARKPTDRYQTPKELLEDIENLGKGDKRIEELLSGDGDDSSPIAATPAFGTPLALPPRHLPNRSGDTSRQTGRAKSEPTPPPERTPGRRGKRGTEETPPPQRMPGRTVKGESDSSPSGHRLLPRRAHDESEPETNAPAQRLPGQHAADEPDSSPPPERVPGRYVPDDEEPSRLQHRLPGRLPKNGQDSPATAGRMPGRHVPGDPHDPSPQSGTRARRLRSVSEDPVTSAREGAAAGEGIKFDWKPLAIKAAPVAGGLLALGLCAWLALAWRSSAKETKGTGVSAIAPASAQLPGGAPKADAPDKQNDDAAKTDVNGKGLRTDPGLLVNLKKGANDPKLADTSAVWGRPEERKKFPAWIPEIWNPNSSGPNSWAELKTIKVGRAGNERADAPSLSAAIESLPEKGGIIELQGRGPFLLPALRIANRRRVIITGAGRNAAPLSAPGTKPAPAKSGMADDDRPLITITPGAGTAAESGLVAVETSLTLYNVDLAAFADQFPGEFPLRLIDVRAGDLTVQKSSLTLIGGRSGPTIAFSVEASSTKSNADHPTRILLDRTFVRGKDLTGLDADLSAVDLLAINSLFVTGKSPSLNLASGASSSAPTAAETTVPRTLQFFSCTTCTEDAAVSLRSTGTAGALPPPTRFRVMNSVFGAVFQPQGATMLALNNWPMRPLTTTNHVAYENLVWMTESFIARGWQNLVQNDASPPLGTKDANKWGAFWGEASSAIDYEPASFPPSPDIGTALPAQFKIDGPTSVPNAGGDTGPAGCDLALLAVSSPELVARANAFSRRPQIPAAFVSSAAGDSNVREINLDNPNHRELENLAKFINRSDWKSGTRFLVRGTNRKMCGPIRVANHSLRIEFVDKTPPLLTFDEPRDSRDHSAFISVTGGSIEIVNANFRVAASVKHVPHWFLEVKDGNFAIRDSSIEGPPFEKSGYEGLIHFSSGHIAAVPAAPKQAYCGYIFDSFLRTGKNVLSGDRAWGNLIVENSVLAANGRVFDLRTSANSTSASSATPAAIDLQACTLAAGEEYFHFDPAAGKSSGRMRIVADKTVFTPPLQISDNRAAKAVLIGGLPAASIAESIEWWEYACAYSNLISLPTVEGDGAGSRDPLAGWRQLASPGHIVRSIASANAVVLPYDLPPAKELVANNFRLRTEAEAATWSDTGKPIGAVLAWQSAPAPLPTPTPKGKAAGSSKSPASKKTAPKGSGF